MIGCIRSLTLRLGRFCRCGWAEHVSAQANSLLELQIELQITAEQALLSFRSAHRKPPGALIAAQSLQPSPRASIAAVRFLSKSP